MGNDLKLRRWRADDCRAIYDWRVDPATMRWCIDRRLFPYEEHERWFAAFLADTGRYGFILEDAGEAVAQIRFDPAEMPGCYRISLAAAPGKSGKGYGSSILRLACQSEEMRGCATLLVAETLVDNLPSQKIFVRNGFINAGHGSCGDTALICWLLPLAVTPQPVLLQFLAEPAWLEDIERILSATGLALSGDANARVKIFMGTAVSNEELYSSALLHLNIGESTLLDLAIRFPAELRLPIEFYNPLTAVAQIAASLLYLQQN
jgi:RimJ/RimL family protein N-acetyltransferase